jgi:hypothetical protein
MIDYAEGAKAAAFRKDLIQIRAKLRANQFEGGAMRVVLGVAVMVAVLAADLILSSAAMADTVINVPTDAQRNFCIYNSKIFSIGAVICIGNGRGEICETGEGNAPRARWSRLTRDGEVSETCLDLRPEAIK